jgi:hypothetical protein
MIKTNKFFFRLLRIRSWDSQQLLWAQTAKSRMHLGRGRMSKQLLFFSYPWIQESPQLLPKRKDLETLS